MTDIEQKALALVNEIERERAADNYEDKIERIMRALIMDEALCRAIEQHEAFKQKVSDAVEAYCELWAPHFPPVLNQFIIPKPKPDLLVEVLQESDQEFDPEWGFSPKWYYAPQAKAIRAALEARGLEIRSKNDDE